jgi:uncharacterized SAM-binding protein YcdF (DUF218 family)
MKRLLSLFVIVVVFVALVSAYLQPNNFIGCSAAPSESDECAAADAIVVVSGGDTVARTATGIQLFKEGWSDTLIFSGAALDKTGPSNAEAMQRQAVQAGVPLSAIVVDKESESTLENAKYTKTIFANRGYDDIILVTSGYHQRRASLEFNKLAESVTIRNYPVNQDGDWGWYWWATPRGWWLAGSELVKIAAFYLGATS